MPLSEFELIERFFRRGVNASRPASAPSTVSLGIGDDCAILTPPPGEQLLISVDTLVEGVHFPKAFHPADLARRALAVCVSDLAACGAQPAAYTLALTLPEVSEAWLAPFAEALHQAGADFGMALIGGDTTKGPLTLSFQVMGFAPAGAALLRSGAEVGDNIYVSGYLGEARAALNWLDQPQLNGHQAQLMQRYLAPQPRLALGLALRGVASAAVDISDGLAADLGHILAASQVGATLHSERLPVSPALRGEAGEQALEYALGGGDDYELCFTAPPPHHEQVLAISQTIGLPIHLVGHIEADSGLRCLNDNGQLRSLPGGYQHF
ncbi:thiamine-phosphate kinase [Spongiibacter taiwanensis]|uniref:thiamine-phosphate kinase n=1 Tax=Spongiibacter taiwanensis TaxID=1748242 RepID=UPI0020351887|nr:thiamine-phosphate kinase [Spongiibacter taiwanensis]USA42016.1 thiamine-phosphate kinase [Spongiibacter taiwanensis]